MNEQFEMIAKTFQGLEEVLIEEAVVLGANDVQNGRRIGFIFRRQNDMYKT